jgi:hypothetical protein
VSPPPIVTGPAWRTGADCIRALMACRPNQTTTRDVWRVIFLFFSVRTTSAVSNDCSHADIKTVVVLMAGTARGLNQVSGITEG